MKSYRKGIAVGAIGLLMLQAAAVASYDALAQRPAPVQPRADPAACTPEVEAANRALAERMVRPRPETIIAALHPDFIQHSPDSLRFMEVNNTYGRAGMELLIAAFAKIGYAPWNRPAGAVMPPPPVPEDTQILVQCDLVVAVHSMWEPDPQKPGKFYKIWGFDLWRVRDGMLYEHWDAQKIKMPVLPYLEAPFDKLAPMAQGAGH